tara:strand:+ start:603 stop:836 length:234 start_codon:yes stop_codon:yes gene_type:complete
MPISLTQPKSQKQQRSFFIMSAMKREYEDKINQDLENKQEEKDLLLDQFKKGEIDLKTYVDGMNAVDGMRVMNGELS